MPSLIHLSDLHFGPSYILHLGDLVLADIETWNPDAVIISGDLTFRAQHREYQAARDFLKSISQPTLAIPGNHDQILFNPIQRLVRPLARYQNYINVATDSSIQANGFFVLGLNDNRPILPGGFWSRAQRAWLAAQMSSASQHAAKIVVTHHQLMWEGRWRPSGFWYPSSALDFLADLKVELVLNGHTHIPTAIQTPAGIVVARAGTATNSRTRHGFGNSYNLITIDEKRISIFVQHYDSNAAKFVAAQKFTFARRMRQTRSE